MSKITDLELFIHAEPYATNNNQFDYGKAIATPYKKIMTFAKEVKSAIDTLIVTKTITLNEDIAEQKEYELPISYRVGNDSLKIYWQGVILEQGEDGNYIEVGEKGQASNKVKFGWNLEAGETLVIEVRGDTNE